MNLDKLKDTARRHELREEWRKAIEIYQRALQDVAKGGEPADPSLYNRIGDLELKAGETGAAVHAYEQAADTYTEQGFFNNAIALCGKILRVNPGRTATFLRLADLHARKNVLAESRRNLSEYVERMLAASQNEQLTPALKGFVERFAGGAEYRTMIAEVLRGSGRTEKAREYCDRMIAELGLEDESAHLRPRGDSDEGGASGPAGLIFLDTGIDIPGIPMGGPAASAGPVSARDSGAATNPDAFAVAMEIELSADVELLPFVEPTSLGRTRRPRIIAPRPEWIRADRPGDRDAPPRARRPHRDRGAPRARHDPRTRAPPRILGARHRRPRLRADASRRRSAARSSTIWECRATSTLEPMLEPLFDELSVDDDERAKVGPGATVAELDMAFDNAVADERWDDALKHLVRLIRLEPEVVSRHQKRVEIAYRSGNRNHLIDAYISLAQSLERIGATENAGLVFERVLEHDPENPVALAGLAGLGAQQGRTRRGPRGAIRADSSDIRPNRPGRRNSKAE